MTNEEHTAKASIKDMPISTKQAVEICSFIRGKDIQRAKQMLQQVLEKKLAVPFKRYKMNVAHKPGNIAAGRYPEKATTAMMVLLNSVESNAQDKDLDTERLYIKAIMANKGSRSYRFGRRRGIKARNTHVEIVVEERESSEKQEKPVQQKQTRPQPSPAPQKPEVKKPAKEATRKHT